MKPNPSCIISRNAEETLKLTGRFEVAHQNCPWGGKLGFVAAGGRGPIVVPYKITVVGVDGTSRTVWDYKDPEWPDGPPEELAGRPILESDKLVVESGRGRIKHAITWRCEITDGRVVWNLDAADFLERRSPEFDKEVDHKEFFT